MGILHYHLRLQEAPSSTTHPSWPSLGIAGDAQHAKSFPRRHHPLQLICESAIFGYVYIAAKLNMASTPLGNHP